jgi:hypothetical protein
MLAVNYECLLLGSQAFACNESCVALVAVMSAYFAVYMWQAYACTEPHVISVSMMSFYFVVCMWHSIKHCVLQCFLLVAYGCQSGYPFLSFPNE